jgi:hypothetical protein
LQAGGGVIERLRSFLALRRISVINSAQAEDVFVATRRTGGDIRSDVDLATAFEISQVRWLLEGYYEDLSLVGIHPSGVWVFEKCFAGIMLQKETTFRSLFKKVVGKPAVILNRAQIDQIDMESGICLTVGDYVRSIPELASAMTDQEIELLQSSPCGLPLQDQAEPPGFTVVYAESSKQAAIVRGFVYESAVAQKEDSELRAGAPLSGHAVSLFLVSDGQFFVQVEIEPSNPAARTHFVVKRELFFSNGIILELEDY